MKKSQKNHGGILTEVLISQLVLILGFKTWYRIKAKIIVLYETNCATLKQSAEKKLAILYVCAFQFAIIFHSFLKFSLLFMNIQIRFL